jgi:hypothetical protein
MEFTRCFLDSNSWYPKLRNGVYVSDLAIAVELAINDKQILCLLSTRKKYANTANIGNISTNSKKYKNIYFFNFFETFKATIASNRQTAT